MKRVVLVRHAKAVPYGYDDDFSRDLKNPRGLNDASKVSLEMHNYSIIPDLIIASPAKRALKTARIFADNLGYQANNIKTEEDLYEGISTHEFAGLLKKLDDKINIVYVFGHNPTLYYLIKGFAPLFSGEMPTSSAVCIEFKVKNWIDIEPGGGEFSFQVTPRMIK